MRGKGYETRSKYVFQSGKFIVTLQKEFENEKSDMIKSLKMNSLWIIDDIETWNKRYNIFPMYDEDQKDILLDKWMVSYGDQCF